MQHTADTCNGWHLACRCMARATRPQAQCATPGLLTQAACSPHVLLEQSRSTLTMIWHRHQRVLLATHKGSYHSHVWHTTGQNGTPQLIFEALHCMKQAGGTSTTRLASFWPMMALAQTCTGTNLAGMQMVPHANVLTPPPWQLHGNCMATAW